MIGGVLDALMGKVDYTARAPRLDTRAGQAAIRNQAQFGGDQALAQAYSLAASGRGGGADQALAFREAQRRGAEATGNLQANAVAQQQQLQQAAQQQQLNAEMQAQQINAGIAQNNAQGLQRLAGTALMAGAMMSDVRQKEMLSDFDSKEVPGAYIPQPVRSGVDPNALANPAVNRYLEDRRNQMFAREQGQIADAYDRGPSALQTLGVTPEQGQEAAMYRDSGQLPDQQAAMQLAQQERAAPPDAMTKQERGLSMLGQYLMSSDYTQKELIKARPAHFPAADISAPRVNRMADYQYHQAKRELEDAQARRDAFERLGYVQNVTLPLIQKRMPVQQGMISDFRQKELDPVQPTLYRYNPASSYRQALEASQQAFQNTLEDKRAPRMGIVAQDLQHSKAFAPSVVQKDDGQLAIDRDRALSTALAELGGMHQRLRRLETKRGA